MSELALKLIHENRRQYEAGDPACKGLSLEFCGLKEIPKAIVDYYWLETLLISNNQIRKLENLPINLKSLYISANQIEKLENLPNCLSHLSIGSNQIKKIENLPDSINKLDISNNKIKDLSKIKHLIVERGLIPVLEHDMFFAFMQTKIPVAGNPLTTPPPEIIKQGRGAIINYFDELEAGKDYLYEGKMLIVGEARVGKTSLRTKLENVDSDLPHEYDTTHGIDITIHKDSFTTDDGHPFISHIWDFGGQVIYHATHQFFLTKRSLYILVDDSSRDDVDLDYWFQVIEKLTDNSPVLVLQNQKKCRIKDIGIKDLRGRYENIKDFFEIDLDQANKKHKKVFGNLQDAIKYQMQHLPLVGMELPKTWVDVRRELNRILKEEELPYISKERYELVCEKFQITEPERIEAMSSALHDLGIFLYFMDNPVLENTVIIENEWATKAVYDLVNDVKITRNNGHFDLADVKRIWKHEKYRGKHSQLLELCKMFELIYEIPLKNGEQFIAPQLLPTSRPAYLWDFENNLRLVYEYPFLPKGLISRLIVRMNRFIKNTATDAWRSGVVLSRINTKAEIREVYGEKKIEIRLQGDECKEFLVVIQDHFAELHLSYNNLKTEKLIPCICELCKERDENLGKAKEDSEREKMEQPWFYKQSSLKRRLQMNESKVQCEFSFKYLHAQDLLDNIYRTAYGEVKPPLEVREKLKVFLSYSKADVEHIETFEKSIKPLIKNEKIEVFYDLKMVEGDWVHERIRQEIKNADIIIFFISMESLATDYILDIEIPLALERYKAQHDKVMLFPVLLEDCLWDEYFGDYYIYNKAKPFLEEDNQKKAWNTLVKRFREVVTHFGMLSSKIIKEDEKIGNHGK